MRYSLMNKDVCVAEFSLTESVNTLGISAVAVNDLCVLDNRLYPQIVGIRALESFLSGRRAPNRRRHMAELFRCLDMYSLDKFLNTSLALSLTDTVWVKPEGIDVVWADVSLYISKFSNSIANYAFSGNGLADALCGGRSPEYTTDGVLPKCWVRDPGGTIKLQKGSSAYLGFRNSGFEPCSEFYAAQVAKRMEMYPYVDYDLVMVDGNLSSVCDLFTSENTAYVSMDEELRRNATSVYDYTRVLEQYGLLESYKDLVIFDCLICNPDRHMGNFGFLKDSGTYAVMGLSPIFDNGMGLGALWTRDNYAGDSVVEYTSKEGPRLFDGAGYVTVGRRVLNDRRRHAIEKLKEWTIPKHPLYNWPDWKYDAMNELLQHQVREILM